MQLSSLKSQRENGKGKKRTILFVSNTATSPTGYGMQTALFTPRIRDAGYEVAVAATYGREGVPAWNQQGILELPRLVHPHLNDIISTHAAFVEADVVLSLYDAFAFVPDVWEKVNWVAWAPIDCDPISPQNDESLKVARRVWSMSKWSDRVLRDAGYDTTYVPLAVDTNVYKPMDRVLALAEMEKFLKVDLQNKFIVTSVAANKGTPCRKNFYAMFDAFAQFAADKPDAVFYVHTDPHGIWQGDDLEALSEQFGIADRVIFPPGYDYNFGLVDQETLNAIYNASDVHMLLSLGEGFGVPIVEAQAAGCPVIVSDGSTEELCFGDWLVPTTPIQAWGRHGCNWHWADVHQALRYLREAYYERGTERAAERRAQARLGALEYDIDHVFETYMIPALEALDYAYTHGDDGTGDAGAGAVAGGRDGLAGPGASEPARPVSDGGPGAADGPAAGAD
jgi:glycosyltransferase involved in cell wall biosynthesis